MVPALSLVFSAAVERTGGARDAANKDRQAIAQHIELKREAVKDAKVVADEDELAAKIDCASGRKAKCLGLEARADISRQRLEAARTELAQAGVVPTDPQARRLAAILPVSEEAIQLYQPLILPLAISALGLLLIAVGAHEFEVVEPETATVLEPLPEPAPRQKVVDWVAEFRRRNNRNPRIPEVQAEFKTMPKTSAWRAANR